jgi:hypothetical protein
MFCKWNFSFLLSKLNKRDLPFCLQGSDARKHLDGRLNIWDFGGQIFFHEIHRQYVGDTDLYVICSNSSRNRSSEEAPEGLNEEDWKDANSILPEEYWENFVREASGQVDPLIIKLQIQGAPVSSADTLSDLKGKKLDDLEFVAFLDYLNCKILPLQVSNACITEGLSIIQECLRGKRELLNDYYGDGRKEAPVIETKIDFWANCGFVPESKWMELLHNWIPGIQFSRAQARGLARYYHRHGELTYLKFGKSIGESYSVVLDSRFFLEVLYKSLIYNSGIDVKGEKFSFYSYIRLNNGFIEQDKFDSVVYKVLHDVLVSWDLNDPEYISISEAKETFVKMLLDYLVEVGFIAEIGESFPTKSGWLHLRHPFYTFKYSHYRPADQIHKEQEVETGWSKLRKKYTTSTYLCFGSTGLGVPANILYQLLDHYLGKGEVSDFIAWRTGMQFHVKISNDSTESIGEHGKRKRRRAYDGNESFDGSSDFDGSRINKDPFEAGLRFEKTIRENHSEALFITVLSSHSEDMTFDRVLLDLFNPGNPFYKLTRPSAQGSATDVYTDPVNRMKVSGLEIGEDQKVTFSRSPAAVYSLKLRSRDAYKYDFAISNQSAQTEFAQLLTDHLRATGRSVFWYRESQHDEVLDDIESMDRLIVKLATAKHTIIIGSKDYFSVAEGNMYCAFEYITLLARDSKFRTARERSLQVNVDMDEDNLYAEKSIGSIKAFYQRVYNRWNKLEYNLGVEADLVGDEDNEQESRLRQWKRVVMGWLKADPIVMANRQEMEIRNDNYMKIDSKNLDSRAKDVVSKCEKLGWL